METIKVNYNEFMFLQARTSDYHYISENSFIVIEDIKSISNETCYYISWRYGGRTKNNWFNIEQLEFVCKAHKQWLGEKSHNFQEWNRILQKIKNKKGRE